MDVECASCDVSQLMSDVTSCEMIWSVMTWNDDITWWYSAHSLMTWYNHRTIWSHTCPDMCTHDMHMNVHSGQSGAAPGAPQTRPRIVVWVSRAIKLYEWTRELRTLTNRCYWLLGPYSAGASHPSDTVPYIRIVGSKLCTRMIFIYIILERIEVYDLWAESRGSASSYVSYTHTHTHTHTHDVV